MRGGAKPRERKFLLWLSCIIIVSVFTFVLSYLLILLLTCRFAARRAFVELVYVDEEDTLSGSYSDENNEVKFRRTIRPNGMASYSINRKEVAAKKYQDVLKSIGILVKARNFLVFQVQRYFFPA